MRRSALMAVLAVALSASVATAQDAKSDWKSLLELGNKLAQETTTRADQDGFKVSYELRVEGDERQLGLYGVHGALQSLDVMTTMSALASPGNREANPLFKSGNPSTMIAAKAVAMGVNVYAAEKLAKRNKKAARWMMLASNAVMTGIVVNNAVR